MRYTTISLLEDPKAFIIAALERNGGNVCKSTADLGVCRKTFYNMLHRYGIFEEMREIRRRYFASLKAKRTLPPGLR